MKRLHFVMILSITITTTGCGKITQLYDSSLDTINHQNELNQALLDKLNAVPTQNAQQPAIITPTPQIIVVIPPPTTIIVNPAPVQKIAPSLKIVRNGHDMTLYWTDVHAESYTIYRNFYSPKLENMWVKVTTFSGFSMFFAHVYEHGTHHYRVDANFEDGVTRSSIITFTGQE